MTPWLVHELRGRGLNVVCLDARHASAALSGRRDRALPLIGYAGALRRWELIATTREDVVFPADGLRLTIPRAKADQAGKGGASLGIPG